MSEVTGCGILKVILTKNVKEIFWDLKFLSEVTWCRKTQVSDFTVYPKYKLHTNFIRNWPRLRQATWRWIHIPMIKRGWYFCTHQKLAFIPISKAHTNKYYIVRQCTYIIYIYTCLNQTLNKPESCINLTLNQDSMQDIFVNLTCITEHMSLLNWKGGPNEVRFRQVSLKWTYLSLA